MHVAHSETPSRPVGDAPRRSDPAPSYSLCMSPSTSRFVHLIMSPFHFPPSIGVGNRGRQWHERHLLPPPAAGRHDGPVPVALLLPLPLPLPAVHLPSPRHHIQVPVPVVVVVMVPTRRAPRETAGLGPGLGPGYRLFPSSFCWRRRVGRMPAVDAGVRHRPRPLPRQRHVQPAAGNRPALQRAHGPLRFLVRDEVDEAVVVVAGERAGRGVWGDALADGHAFCFGLSSPPPGGGGKRVVLVLVLLGGG